MARVACTSLIVLVYLFFVYTCLAMDPTATVDVVRRQHSRWRFECISCFSTFSSDTVELRCLRVLEEYRIPVTEERKQWCEELTEVDLDLFEALEHHLQRIESQRGAVDVAYIDTWLSHLHQFSNVAMSECAESLLDHDYQYGPDYIELCSGLHATYQIQLLEAALNVFTDRFGIRTWGQVIRGTSHRRYQRLSFAELKMLMQIPHDQHELVAEALMAALHNVRRFPQRSTQFENVLLQLMSTQRPMTVVCLRVINQHGKTIITPDLAVFCLQAVESELELRNMRLYFNTLASFETEQPCNIRALRVVVRAHSDLGLSAVLRVMYANRLESEKAPTHEVMNVLRLTHDAATLDCIDQFVDHKKPLLDVRYAWLCMERPKFIHNILEDLLPYQDMDSASKFCRLLGFEKNPSVRQCLRHFRNEPWVLAICTYSTQPFALNAMQTVQENRLKYEAHLDYAHLRIAAMATAQEHVDCLDRSATLLAVSLVQSCVETGVSLDQWTSKDVDDSTESEGGIECPICFDAIGNEQLYEWPGCCHEFDAACILSTRLRQKPDVPFCCPICRRPDV